MGAVLGLVISAVLGVVLAVLGALTFAQIGANQALGSDKTQITAPLVDYGAR